MSNNTLHDDVQALKEKVALLDGWRLGESDRYDRLERDVAGIKDELHLFRSDIDKRFVQMDTRFHQLDSKIDAQGQQINSRIDAQGRELGARIDGQGRELGARIDAQGQQLGARIDAQGQQLTARIDAQERRLNQLVWLMLVTAVGVATNLAVQLLK